MIRLKKVQIFRSKTLKYRGRKGLTAVLFILLKCMFLLDPRFLDRVLGFFYGFTSCQVSNFFIRCLAHDYPLNLRVELYFLHNNIRYKTTRTTAG